MPNPTIYDRWSDAAPFDRLLFRPDRILQSAEVNELQSAFNWRLRGVTDVLFKDGDIVRDAGIVVTLPSGSTLCQSGAVYIDGVVRGVPQQTITIPVAGNIVVGLYLTRVTVTELEDPTLLNPAAGTRGYMLPGSARERVLLAWGHESDGSAGTFYPIWLVEDGVVRPKEPPPNLDAVTQALARYDRDSSGGSYIVRGLQLRPLDDLPSGDQAYALAEGAARVAGRGHAFAATRRVLHAATPDTLWIDSETHLSTTEGAQRVNIHRYPAVGGIEFRVTSRRTVDVVHGGFAGAADPLPDTSVLALEAVVQGGTTYTSGTDFNLNAGQVDWSPAGAEPAPGSTYQVTYTYVHLVAPTAPDDKGGTVAGALPGTLIQVSYSHALRRIDRLVLTTEGDLVWITGLAAPWVPVPPPVPADALALASVYQFWDERRRVALDGVRMVPMDTLNEYDRRMGDIRTDLAELRLAVDIAGKHSGIKKGLFADPLRDDSLRDAGQAQTGQIIAGALRLPLAVTATRVGTQLTARTAPTHTDTPVLSQPWRTDAMKVNPYAAFAPLPRAAVLRPSVDRWTESKDRWINGGDPNRRSDANFVVTNTVIGTLTSAIENLRATPVRFDLAFPTGETLTQVQFGEVLVPVAPLDGGTLTAGPDGLSGTFVTPDTLPAGTYEVRFSGAAGTTASALFTGQGTLIEREIRQVIAARPQNTDPLAQTFTLTAPVQTTGVRLRYSAKGSSAAVVQIRECAQGLPTSNVLAEGRIAPAAIKVDGTQTLVSWPPTLLLPDREYALVVFSDDADAAVAIAALGGWDEHALGWVTSQPYQIGVLLSSSNASTWTAHQDRDLHFDLLAADYGAAGSTQHIDLGSAPVVDVTDLMVAAYAHQPSADSGCAFTLTLDDASAYQVAPGQVVQLPARYTGDVAVAVDLSGKQRLGAVLEPSVQLMAASLQLEGTYISPTVTAGTGSTVRVIYDADLPAGSACVVHVQSAETGAPWVPVPFLSSSPATVGVLELTHSLEAFDATALRVRLTLTGTHAARPAITNLRVVVL